MRILVYSHTVPMPDRSAGWLRFFNLLQVMAGDNEVVLHPTELDWQVQKYGAELVAGYEAALGAAGIHVTRGAWQDHQRLLRSAPFQTVVFEHYDTVRPQTVEEFRFHHPAARILVDTIDVAFSRLESKARITGRAEDAHHAAEVKAAEMQAYRSADAVIAVSRAERELLRSVDPALHVETVPLIYPVPPLPDAQRSRRRHVLFIADFGHDANVDGIVHFCQSALPLIVREIPDVRLRIAGAAVTPEVQALAGPNVEILGFVRDLAELYRESDVSIAPMRFGGGLKGKIAEAMAYGVPVVTNTACAQGFDVTAGEELVVGDDPVAFAAGVVRLLGDDAMHRRVRQAGWNHVKAHFSQEVVADRLLDLLRRIDELPRRPLPLRRRLVRGARRSLERHVLWRFQK